LEAGIELACLVGYGFVGEQMWVNVHGPSVAGNSGAHVGLSQYLVADRRIECRAINQRRVVDADS